MYYGARYYDPELGRFIQPDTVLDGLNRYAYCHNNPVKYVDPTGHEDEITLDDSWEKEETNKQVERWEHVYKDDSDSGGGTGASGDGGTPPVVDTPWWESLFHIYVPGYTFVDASVQSFQQGDIGSGLGYLGMAVAYDTMWVLGGEMLSGIIGAVTSAGTSAAVKAATPSSTTFKINNWGGYPEGLPKPQGPFRLLEGAEYQQARAAANSANQAIRKVDPALKGLQIHEIHPVKFGGSPIDPANKIPLTLSAHSQVTAWWNQLLRNLQ